MSRDTASFTLRSPHNGLLERSDPELTDITRQEVLLISKHPTALIFSSERCWKTSWERKTEKSDHLQRHCELKGSPGRLSLKSQVTSSQVNCNAGRSTDFCVTRTLALFDLISCKNIFLKKNSRDDGFLLDFNVSICAAEHHISHLLSEKHHDIIIISNCYLILISHTHIFSDH